MEAASSSPAEDVEALRAELAGAKAEAARVKAINADLEARNALLELQNEKMRRALYGQCSKRARQLIDQLELGFEELEYRPARTRRLRASPLPARVSLRSRANDQRANPCLSISRASASSSRRHARAQHAAAIAFPSSARM